MSKQIAVLRLVVVAGLAAAGAGFLFTPGVKLDAPDRSSPAAPEREDHAAEAQAFQALQRQTGGAAGRSGMDALREPLDPQRYAPARRHVAAMPAIAPALHADSSRAAGGAHPNIAASSTWTSLGPNNVGGRTRALLINPTNSSLMYAGGVGGGIWKTTDGGANWAQTAGMPSNLAVSSLAMDPSNTGVLYAGTGEGFFNGDRIRGNGIFKSSDGGATWSQLAGTNTSDFRYVNKVLVSSHVSSVLYAATRTGLWLSTDGGTTWARSLNPTGQSGNPLKGGCTDLALRTDQSTDALLAACGTFTADTGFGDVAGVWLNTNPGGGGLWSKKLSQANMDRTSLAIAPSNQGIVYALAASGQSGNYNEGLLAVFKSTDGGATWAATVSNTSATTLNTLLLTNVEFTQCPAFTPNGFNNQGWYDNVIAVDPTNSNTVWVGGVDVFRSDDGGQNFNIASRWAQVNPSDAPNVSHADRHGIVFDPGYNGTTNQTVFLADDGGIQKTTNALAATTSSICNGSSSIVWNTLNNGYHTAQFYYGAVYPSGATYFGGLQDNGTVRNTSGSTTGAWDTLFGGDGGAVAVDPTNTNTLFVETTNLSLQKSTDGGATFNDATSGITEASGNFQFIAPFVMDQINPQVLWIGGKTLWRTSNQAASWTQASAPFAAAQGAVSAIAVAPSNDNVVLVGTDSGYILSSTSALSTTSATTWSSVQLAGAGYVSSLAFNPTNALIAYATVSSFGSKHIFQSTDGGATWNSIDGSGTASIPDAPVNTVLVDPNNAQAIFLGSDLGAFLSLDAGSTWNTLNSGFGNEAVRSLVYDQSARNVFAFTHGLGAYVISAAQFELAAPTSLTATAGNQQVGLSWTASAGATSYNIYQGTAAGGESGTAVQTGLTTSSTTVTGLANGTKYFFVVKAVNGNGISPASNEASATPQPPPPAAPAGLGATAGVQQATLNWTASAGATSYNVYQGTAAGGESAAAVQTGLTTTGATISGLTSGTTYFFVVKAVNTGGISPASNEASATALPPPPPAPAALGATAGIQQATLNWTASAGAASYNVYQGTAAGGESAAPVLSGLTATTTTVSGLIGGTTYFFVVKAVNAAGISPASNEASVTALPPPPPAPAGLGATAGVQQAILNWSAAAGATSYNVYQGTAAGGESATAVLTAITTTSATVTGLTSGTAYFFVVKALNAGGISPASNEASAAPPPAAPTGLAATAGDQQASLSWTASAGAASYNVYQGTAAGGESIGAVQTGLTTTGATITGLSNGTAYFFIVKAVNAGGSSPASNEASATPMGPGKGGGAFGSSVLAMLATLAAARRRRHGRTQERG